MFTELYSCHCLVTYSFNSTADGGGCLTSLIQNLTILGILLGINFEVSSYAALFLSLILHFKALYPKIQEEDTRYPLVAVL